MKFVFWLLLVCVNIDVVKARGLDLQIAINRMRKRLSESATASIEMDTTMDYITVLPLDTIVTSTTALPDTSVALSVTLPMLPVSVPSTIHSHGSLVRAVLDRISRECTWGDERCTELEAAVEQIMDRAIHVPRGTAEPSLVVMAASVISIVVCLSLVVGGLTGLVLILDRFLPAEAVFDGLSAVGHASLHCFNGVWRFFQRDQGSRSQL